MNALHNSACSQLLSGTLTSDKSLRNNMCYTIIYCRRFGWVSGARIHPHVGLLPMRICVCACLLRAAQEVCEWVSVCVRWRRAHKVVDTLTSHEHTTIGQIKCNRMTMTIGTTYCLLCRAHIFVKYASAMDQTSPILFRFSCLFFR